MIILWSRMNGLKLDLTFFKVDAERSCIFKLWHLKTLTVRWEDWWIRPEIINLYKPRITAERIYGHAAPEMFILFPVVNKLEYFVPPCLRPKKLVPFCFPYKEDQHATDVSVSCRYTQGIFPSNSLNSIVSSYRSHYPEFVTILEWVTFLYVWETCFYTDKQRWWAFMSMLYTRSWDTLIS